ncbi:Na+ dependent nucleoside transporter C-terminus-domain-containing protein [Pilobolus umbonatus]|nr:Na+ dependent nucleoside transporter C-terminus-domain-containing protein [Pilobolus umbonatus]
MDTSIEIESVKGEQTEGEPVMVQPMVPWKYKKHTCVISWCLFTVFLITSYVLQIPKGYHPNLLVLGILYITFTLILVPIPTLHVPSLPVISPLYFSSFVLCVMIVVVFSLPEKEASPRLNRCISFLGLFVFIGGTYATSKSRDHVSWNTISGALFMQFLLALFVFRTPVGHDLFQWISEFVEHYLQKATYGTEFVFGADIANSNTFAVSLFPATIFFASTVQVLYCLGWIQASCQFLAAGFTYFLNISGAESIVAVASPFLGACENALLIEPLLSQLTDSELHQILTSGFATISGSVFYAYISMGVSGSSLLTSCIMSIPCSIMISKLRYPEVSTPTPLVFPAKEKNTLLQAVGKGAELGIQISLLITANIISILAIVYALNGLLTWLGQFVNIQELKLESITGYLFVPIAWLIGVDSKDVVIVGRLMAVKIWINEFVAYKLMTDEYKGILSARSELVTTYALCGFANFGTVGMQMGVLGALAPSKMSVIAKLALSALICGSLSTWLSAAMAGMLI